MMVLGLDTSNYTTSAAAFDGVSGKNCSRLLDVREGELGLRQSDALFSHVKRLPELVEKLFTEISRDEIRAVGASTRPRAVEGSYMPCFLAGSSQAQNLATVLGVPFYAFSHQQGHIAAACWSSGRMDLMDTPHLAWHLSGGTTELLLSDNMNITRLGGTKDISAGMAIDRTGVLLGMKFPCGKELETVAGDMPEKVKPGKISVTDFDCNLSGLENKVSELISSGADRQYIAAYVLSFVCAVIDRMAENAVAAYPGLPVIFSGGVMSNRFMRRRLSEKYGNYFAEPQFSCDNAAGIARLTAMRHCGEI